MIEVELPDGTIVEFPEGTSQDVMLRALKTLTQSQKSPMQQRIEAAKAGTLQASPESLARAAQANAQAELLMNDPGALATALLGATQGATFGFGDEIAAGLASIMPGGPTYEQGLGIARRGLEAGRELRPVTAIGSEIAGSMVAGLGMAAAAPASVAARLVGPTSSRLLPAIGRGALLGAPIGAAEGAITGFGSGEGGLGERLSSAASGGVLGGVGGGLLGGAVPAIAKGAQNVIGRFRRSDVAKIAQDLGISQDAAKVIRNVFDQGGGIEEARAMLMRAGDDGMLADAGYAAQSLLDASIQTGGAASQIGRTAVDARSAGIDRRLTGALDEALGAPQGITTMQKAIREGTAPERQRLYDEAFGVEIDWRSPAGEQLRGLLDTTPPEVLAGAARTQAMARRVDPLAARYADEFAPTVTSKPGEFSGNYAERQDINAFYAALKDASAPKMKRPFTDLIKKRGGIDPNSPLASDLRAMGITSQSTPGIFKSGGLKDVDNLDTSGLPDVLRAQIDDGGTYVNRQAIIDALQSELSGTAIEDTTETVGRQTLLDLERLKPEYDARLMALKNAEKAAEKGPTAPDAPGEIVPMKTIKDIDAIKRYLQEIQDTNEGRGLLGGQTEYGMEAGRRAREIRDLLAEISPAYKDALANASDAIRRVKSVDAGAQLLNPSFTREKVAQFLNDATPGERAAAALGVRQSIDETIANVKSNISNPNVDIAQGIRAVKDLSSDASREKITALIGAERAAPLFKSLDEAMAQLELRAATQRGSATAVRQAVQGQVDEITSPGMVGRAMRGEPIDAAKNMVKAVTGFTDEYTAAQKQRIYADIAKALTERRGASAQAALNYIDQAMKGQPLTDAQNEFVAQQVAGALFVTATPQTTRAMERSQ